MPPLAAKHSPILVFGLCPHAAGPNLSGWELFAAFLRRATGVRIRLQPGWDWPTFRRSLQQYDLAFVEGAAALELAAQGWLPVAATQEADEALFVTATNGEEIFGLESLQGAVLAVVPGTLVTETGLKVLRAHGIHPAAVAAQPSCRAVLRAAGEGRAAVGLVCGHVQRRLSRFWRRQIRLLPRGRWDAPLGHLLMLQEGSLDWVRRAEEALSSMAGDEAGRRLLTEIGVVGWQRAGKALSRAALR